MKDEYEAIKGRYSAFFKPKEEQDACEHKLVFNLMPLGCVYCLKCGFRREFEEHELDDI